MCPCHGHVQQTWPYFIIFWIRNKGMGMIWTWFLNRSRPAENLAKTGKRSRSPVLNKTKLNNLVNEIWKSDHLKRGRGFSKMTPLLFLNPWTSAPESLAVSDLSKSKKQSAWKRPFDPLDIIAKTCIRDILRRPSRQPLKKERRWEFNLKSLYSIDI